MKKIITFFTIVLLLAAGILVAYQSLPGFQEQVMSLVEENFTQENIYSDLDSISQRLQQEILSGTESFTIYLKDMDLQEIQQVNASLDGIFGSGASYQQVGTVGDTYTKVIITVKRTMNYYVWKAYTEGEAIPETETKAQELYTVLCHIIDTQITDGMSAYEKEVALHDYLVKNCVYSEDTDLAVGSDVYRAYGALVNGDAVCNGYAEALQLMFMCVGVESRFVVGTADGVDHAWNLVQLDGNWYHLDATWDDPVPDQTGRAIHPFFNVSDAVMEENHTWDKSQYPAADSMEDYYYRKSQAYFENFEDYKQGVWENMVQQEKNWYEATIEGYEPTEEEMQFLFSGNNMYRSISWQTYRQGDLITLVLQAE